MDILEAAIRLTREANIPTVAVFAGDGPERARLEAHAKANGCESQLETLGQVSSRERMMEVLDSGHVYICASASEGLPRGALEGMSRGLPLVGSRLPGLEELLPREELIAIGDVPGFVARIRAIVTTPEAYSAASKRSSEVVRQYLQTVLSGKRRRIYGLLRGIAEGGK
jgi:glycosyltransferase involved in cell wall biosynthesis